MCSPTFAVYYIIESVTENSKGMCLCCVVFL